MPQYVKVFFMVHFARDLKIYRHVCFVSRVRSYIVIPSYLCIIFFLFFFIIRNIKIYFIGHFEVFIMFILSTIFILIYLFKKCFLPHSLISPILCNCHFFPYFPNFILDTFKGYDISFICIFIFEVYNFSLMFHFDPELFLYS